jgi:hypothetical protein
MSNGKTDAPRKDPTGNARKNYNGKYDGIQWRGYSVTELRLANTAGELPEPIDMDTWPIALFNI